MSEDIFVDVSSSGKFMFCLLLLSEFLFELVVDFSFSFPSFFKFSLLAARHCLHAAVHVLSVTMVLSDLSPFLSKRDHLHFLPS